ncbi:hypothetical protein FACS189499_03250 [Clostridia bacterium]|nr:hypothetical protein FACS189499_03250 [Clostridia bacterium]
MKILSIGGDERFRFAADKLSESYTAGIWQENSPPGEDERFGGFLLPINPWGRAEDIIAEYAGQNAVVFAGKPSERLRDFCRENGFSLYDYVNRPDFAEANAVPTAEGTLEIIFRETGRILAGREVLITGYGRLGKVLARYIAALGGKVTVAARKNIDGGTDFTAVKLPEFLTERPENVSRFDIVINTVPALLFTKKHTHRFRRNALIIDLASVSAFPALSRADLRFIHALSLPGKTAPVTAGEIIADTVKAIMEENGL